MIRMEDEVGQLAQRYRDQYGDRATVRLDDDISRAIGRTDWDECRRLQRARLRLRRVELSHQIAERLSICRLGDHSVTRLA